MSAPSDLPLVVGARVEGEGWFVRMTTHDGIDHDFAAETARRLARELFALADVIEGRHAAQVAPSLNAVRPIAPQLGEKAKDAGVIEEQSHRAHDHAGGVLKFKTATGELIDVRVAERLEPFENQRTIGEDASFEPVSVQINDFPAAGFADPLAQIEHGNSPADSGGSVA